MVSAAVHERERSVEALLIILTCYIDHLVPEEVILLKVYWSGRFIHLSFHTRECTSLILAIS